MRRISALLLAFLLVLLESLLPEAWFGSGRSKESQT